MPNLIYDGHTVLFGMDADSEPSLLDIKLVSKAVNRAFRGGKNKTRPPFRQLSLEFNTDEDKDVFRFGNVQGACQYLKTAPGRRSGIVVSISGVIFFISLVNESAYVTRIFDGNSKTRMQVYFCQAREWLYIQDGESLPIFWNGLTVEGAASRSKGGEKKQMPIGRIMCYAHGRVFVANEFNQIAASDVMFGNGFTKSDNVQNFTENIYSNEGGYFTFPVELGEITGMIVLPEMNNLRGQGELIVFGANGAQSFNVGLPRSTWKDAQIQKTILGSRGNQAPSSLIEVNGDPWYRSDDGWSSLTNSRIDDNQKMSFRKFSRDVNNWLDDDTAHLIYYASHIYFNNRLLGTVSPQLSLPRDPENGSHRYFRGMISLDFDRASGLAGGAAFNFDGLWTGIRPTVMCKLGSKAIAFSFDADGENRMYEITKSTGNDNGNKKIKSHYVTKRFAFRPSGSSEFQVKRLTGGETWISDIRDQVGVEISYRSDNSPCWQPFFSLTRTGCDEPEGGLPISKPRFKRWRMGTPDPDVRMAGSDSLACVGSEFQFLVEMEGNLKVDRVRLSSELDKEAELQGDECSGDDDTRFNCELIDCKSVDDYEYLIVPQNA